MTADCFGLTVGNDPHRFLKQDFVLTIFAKDSALGFLTSNERTAQINFRAQIDRHHDSSFTLCDQKRITISQQEDEREPISYPKSSI